jgi:hypothetical protein
MRVNRGGTGGGSSDQGDGSGAMKAPGAGSSGSESPRGSGATRAPSGGGTTQRDGGDAQRSRTDRGNQNDEGIGSSADRGGGGGEANAPRRGADVDEIDNRQGPPGSSENPDLTGTKDVLEE